MKKIALALSLLLSSLALNPPEVSAREFLLTQETIPLMMDQIFEHHIDRHEMTTELMERSFQIYIDQFDRDRIYLTKDEIRDFIEPSQEMLEDALANYREGRVPHFIELHGIIQQAIVRARTWRADIAARLDEMLERADAPIDYDPDDEPDFAETESELHDRWEENFVLFLQSQIQQLGKEVVQRKIDKALSLYDRTRNGHENVYLFYDENSGMLSDVEQEHQLTMLVLKSVAKSLDSHTAYFSPAEAYDMKVRLEKGFEGVGVVLQESIDGVIVTRLIDGGPAQREGSIEANDVIVEVDGVSVVDYSFDKVLDLIRGEEGSTVVFGMKRPVQADSKSGEQYFKVALKRERIIIDDERVDVSWEPFGDGIIGKITLYSFYEGYGGVSSVRDVRNAIRDLHKQGDLKGLVLDLRENTGGFLMQAVKVAGLFISNGVVVVSKYADGELRYFRDIDGHSYYDGPLVVLTSQASASAAEIVAQALQDYGAAIIVGDARTYGKGSIQHQTVTDAESSSFFKVTVGRYYTVSGNSTQIRGVEADIVVPGLYSAEKLGEVFTDYPLPHDTITPLFDDKLSDLDETARHWYLKHYTPSIEKRDDRWRRLLPQLVENSEHRLAANDDYQLFLDIINGEEREDEDPYAVDTEEVRSEGFGDEDLQMSEAVNIIKDMIILDEAYGMEVPDDQSSSLYSIP